MIEDGDINALFEIVKKQTNFSPQSVSWFQGETLKNIQRVQKGVPYIQILFCGEAGFDNIGHYVCAHYDGRNLRIFDSLNKLKSLEDVFSSKNLMLYLSQLFPELNVSTSIYFSTYSSNSIISSI